VNRRLLGKVCKKRDRWQVEVSGSVESALGDVFLYC